MSSELISLSSAGSLFQKRGPATQKDLDPNFSLVYLVSQRTSVSHKDQIKKWYHSFIFHFLDLVIVQSWLIDRRHSDDMGTSRKEQLSLPDFKLDIAACLCVKSEPGVKREGRPSIETQLNIK